MLNILEKWGEMSLTMPAKYVAWRKMSLTMPAKHVA